MPDATCTLNSDANEIRRYLLDPDSNIPAGASAEHAEGLVHEIERLVKKIGEAMGVPVRTPHYPVLPLVVAGHVCEKLCRPFGIVPPIFPRRVDWYRQNRAFKIDKAKRDLGWTPRVGLEEGLKRTAEWYRAEGLL